LGENEIIQLKVPTIVTKIVIVTCFLTGHLCLKTVQLDCSGIYNGLVKTIWTVLPPKSVYIWSIYILDFQKNWSSHLGSISNWNNLSLILTNNLGKGQGYSFLFFNHFSMFIIWSKFWLNRSSRSGYIVKWIIWPLILTFSLKVNVIRFF